MSKMRKWQIIPHGMEGGFIVEAQSYEVTDNLIGGFFVGTTLKHSVPVDKVIVIELNDDQIPTTEQLPKSPTDAT